jgi:hypothetical protein
MRRVRVFMPHFSGAVLIQTCLYPSYAVPGIYYPTLFGPATSLPFVADAL